MFAGCTGVAARAMGKMMAITLAKTIPGHLAAPGRLSETHELIRVQTMDMMLIWLCELDFSCLGSGMTYTKRDDVDLGYGKHSWFSWDVVALDPEDHCGLLALWLLILKMVQLTRSSGLSHLGQKGEEYGDLSSQYHGR